MKILVFAGTTEGRELVEKILKNHVKVTACVATEYGNVLLPHDKNLIVNIGRLHVDEMEPIIRNHDLVIDATHPYADIVTTNIRVACQNMKTEYIRLVRPSLKIDNVVEVKSTEEAAEFLSTISGNVLVTTGSKELEKFTIIPEYENRLFPRVLPTIEVMEKCISLGFCGKNLICIQGPFSYEINVAMMKQYKIKYMVTKDTGTVGGFDEKVKAAKTVGAKIVLINRPTFELDKADSVTMEELMIYLKDNYGIKNFNKVIVKEDKESSSLEKENIKHSSSIQGNLKYKEIVENESLKYFPMFIDMKYKKILVVGGGKIAYRRVNTLLKFGGTVQVVAPEICEDLKNLKEDKLIEVISRGYVSDDIDGKDLVVTATNHREVNYLVGVDAKEAGAFVSVADCKEESNFYFPAVFEDEGVVGGLISKGGNNHSLVKETAKKIRLCLLREEKCNNEKEN